LREEQQDKLGKTERREEEKLKIAEEGKESLDTSRMIRTVKSSAKRGGSLAGKGVARSTTSQLRVPARKQAVRNKTCRTPGI